MFTNKVDQILILKRDNPTADTQEIDKMVCVLYGLNNEESKVVDGN